MPFVIVFECLRKVFYCRYPVQFWHDTDVMQTFQWQAYGQIVQTASLLTSVMSGGLIGISLDIGNYCTFNAPKLMHNVCIHYALINYWSVPDSMTQLPRHICP